MTVFNTTTQVVWEIHDSWKEWLINEQIPAIMQTGLFSNYQLLRLKEVDETEGPTYAMQLYTLSDTEMLQYRETFHEKFEKKSQLLWGDAAFSFSSVMEVVK